MVHWACRYCALENSVVDAATNKSFFEHLTREMMMVKRNTFVIQIIWKQWIDIIFQLRNREMFLLLVEYPVLYVNERVGDWQAGVNDPIFIIVFCLEACGFPC